MFLLGRLFFVVTIGGTSTILTSFNFTSDERICILILPPVDISWRESEKEHCILLRESRETSIYMCEEVYFTKRKHHEQHEDRSCRDIEGSIDHSKEITSFLFCLGFRTEMGSNGFVKDRLQTFLGQCRAFEIFHSANFFSHRFTLNTGDGY